MIFCPVQGFRGKVLGMTPRLSTNDILTEFADNAEAVEFVNKHGVPRGCEIQCWLNNWKKEPVESFCIIDDDSDMVHLKNRLIHTTWQDGLLDCHKDAAIALLEKKQ